MLHLMRVSKSHYARGRAACWLLHRCTLFGPAGAAVRAFNFAVPSPYSVNLVRGRVKLEMLHRVFSGLLLISVDSVDDSPCF